MIASLTFQQSQKLYGMTRIQFVFPAIVMGMVLTVAVSAADVQSSTTTTPSSDSRSLVDAVEAGRTDALDSLNEVSVKQRQPDGMTALHWAVRHGKSDWVTAIIDEGAEVDAVTDYSISPLAIACENGDATIAQILLSAGASPDLTIAGKVTCLMLAARGGDVDVIDTLLRQGADVNAKQRSGQTALMWAAAAGHADAIDRLIAGGANVNESLRSGFTPMMFACRNGHIEAAMRLLDHGVDISAAMEPKNTSGRNPRKGMTALMLAVESGHFDLALRLVGRGADPNDQSSEFAPLHALAWVRRPQVGDTPEGDPPPQIHGSVSSLEFAAKLIDAGADVNLKLRRGKAPGKARFNTRGATPFLMASQTCDLPYMQLLLDHGADPMITNHDDCTALMVAAGVGVHHVGEHPGTIDEVRQAVQWLVELGLDINHVDKNGETAMHGAAYRCFPEIVRLVAKLGADPEIWNHKNRHGWSPLTIAKGYRPGSFKPDPPTIQAVMEVGKITDEDAPTERGWQG
ncbi:ankyrin repeat domain-containing protein [Crateriforma conspicua]|uniref:Ankyrin repeats (3 copies) n=1 Tax=Crateriforma conspicua TaxID=2527996 RepID=A0A5C5Y040_9PLAN|nr:ankyrin repeat domain-containing protein [Crateriforma conspicua]TWT68189.1 Ankyrin repeats (3 copies) [Crateriforma conspicua]